MNLISLSQNVLFTFNILSSFWNVPYPSVPQFQSILERHSYKHAVSAELFDSSSLSLWRSVRSLCGDDGFDRTCNAYSSLIRSVQLM